MTSLRDALASLLLLAATVLGALWLPAVWIADHVVDQDGFLAITQPLADDPEFRTTLTDQAVTALLGDERIPGWIADRIEPVAQEQAARLSETEAYDTMWRGAMVQIHHALLSPGADDVVVDLAPAADALLTRVEETVPLLDLDAPASLPFTVATIPGGSVLEKLAVLDVWGPRLGWAALACAVLAVLVAGHRRAALAGAGIAAILAAAAVWLLTEQVEALVPDRLDQADFIGPLLQVFEARLAADLAPQAMILAGAGAATVVAGALALALLPGRRARR